MARIKRGVPKHIVRLPLDPPECGDWIDIKQVLTSGERGDVLDHAVRRVSQAKPGDHHAETMVDIDYGKQKFAVAAAYVVGWNLVDQTETPIPYVVGSFEARLTQIRALDDATVDAINAALEAHEVALGNAPASGSSSAPAGALTSPSPTSCAEPSVSAT